MIDVEPGVRVFARFFQQARPGAPDDPVLPRHGEIVGEHERWVHLYYESGLNLFVAEFRGYGKSGGISSLHALVADALPVAEYFHRTLDEQGFDRRRFVMGRSMGASPALAIAARAPEGFDGLVIESGAAGVRGMLERNRLAESEEARQLVAAHEAKVRSIRLPTMQLHGEIDLLVPVENAHELYEMLEGAPARRLEFIERAGHNDILWRGQVRYMELLREFVAEYGRASTS